MTAALLLVTWFYYSQPPSSYQTAFDSTEKCEAARVALMAEAKRLRAETPSGLIVRNLPGGGSTVTAPVPPPTLSAVCVAR